MPNSNTQFVTKLKKSNCDKNHDKKLKKNKVVTKLKNTTWDKTQKLKNCDKTHQLINTGRTADQDR